MTDQPKETSAEFDDVIDSLHAAICDRLLAEKPLTKEYAHEVINLVRSAFDRLTRELAERDERIRILRSGPQVSKERFDSLNKEYGELIDRTVAAIPKELSEEGVDFDDYIRSLEKELTRLRSALEKAKEYICNHSNNCMPCPDGVISKSHGLECIEASQALSTGKGSGG